MADWKRTREIREVTNCTSTAKMSTYAVYNLSCNTLTTTACLTASAVMQLIVSRDTRIFPADCSVVQYLLCYVLTLGTSPRREGRGVQALDGVELMILVRASSLQRMLQ